MLRITQSSNASQAKGYYTSADYYSEGQELVGYWRGEAARYLGLSGAIDKKDWNLLCDNRRPDTGLPLTARTKDTRRIGYDFNFHAPKSLSLLYGLTRDERLLHSFQAAVNETMLDIEQDAKARVRKGGKDEDRPTRNLAWGEFIHFTARPENGIPDPHLHAHCFVFNATHDPAESRWKAVQLGDIKRDAPYFEAAFHARLARKMEELGLDTVRTRSGWELAGWSRNTLRQFSRRTQRIEQVAAELGITDPDKKATLGATTRAGKAKTLGMDELAAAWKSGLASRDAALLESLRTQIGARSIEEDRSVAESAVDRSLSHCFERDSVVSERAFLTHALKQGVGKASKESIEVLARARPLIRRQHDGQTMMTTEEVLKDERFMLAFARDGTGACQAVAQGSYQFKRNLNAEQRAAVKHVLQSKDRVTLVRGASGVGKTFMMEEGRDALKHFGHQVIALAPSADASRGVLRSKGFEHADTVAMLLSNPALQEKARDSFIWIDEAGLIGTKDICEVFRLADKLHARIVLTGDRKQHASVSRGSVLRLLETEAGLIPAEIKEIRRQNGAYKAAVKAISEGRIESGFKVLDKLGWIKELDERHRYQALADHYVAAVKRGETALVVSPTHAEGDRITQEIRRQLRESGQLAREERDFSQLVAAHLTPGEKADPLSYERGDVVIFHQNARGFTRGEQFTVGDKAVPLNQAKRFEVFHPHTISLAAGDRIRITKHGKTADGKHRVNNGDSFTVKGFDRRGGIQLDNGWTLASNFGHFDYGLVSTSHASQGKSVQNVFIGQSRMSHRASSREQWYVSVSRGERRAMIFTDDKQALLEAVKVSQPRLSGVELVAEAEMRHRKLVRDGIATLTLDVERTVPTIEQERGHERP